MAGVSAAAAALWQQRKRSSAASAAAFGSSAACSFSPLQPAAARLHHRRWRGVMKYLGGAETAYRWQPYLPVRQQYVGWHRRRKWRKP